MIYLDYAANTPVDPKVLEVFCSLELEYPYNMNNHNSLTLKARQVAKEATQSMADLLGVPKESLIYTSSATESNNLAIKGIAKQYIGKGKHIITTYLEHASVNGPMGALMEEGYQVDFVDLEDSGQVDLNHLASLIRPDTVLISICHVESETGVIQPIEDIGALIKAKSDAFFHVDGTQAVGKIGVNLNKVDAYSFAAHKFYGLNGIGGLVLKPSVLLQPLFHGGMSQSAYRSGTLSLSLVKSMAVALELSYAEMSKRHLAVEKMNQWLREQLAQYPLVAMNSPKNASPYILNISFKGIKGETFKEQLADGGICVSTKSACSAPLAPSKPVLALTKDRKRATSTLRISLSHLTTEAELLQMMAAFSDIYNGLKP